MLVHSLLLFFVCSGFIWGVSTHKIPAPERNNTLFYAVKISPKTDVHHSLLAEKHGFFSHGPIGTLPGGYHLFQRHPSLAHLPPSSLLSSPDIEFAEQQRNLRRIRRQSYGTFDQESSYFYPPQDPLYARQWHLTGFPGLDINVLPAWSRGINGKGIHIGIIDDGLQHSHPDISVNYDDINSYDFFTHSSDPSPIAGDYHGTAAAGLVGAARNSECGVGVAYESSISGIRVLKGENEVMDADEGGALSYHCESGIDIYTCSWGPYDDGRRLEGPGTIARAAMEHCIQNGRNGKGTIYVWAAGNGKPSGDNINYDGYASSRYTIAIGSVTDNKDKTWYAERGSPLMAVTGSSGGTRSITSTSLQGHGDALRDCTNSFGGTSASSPIAAGMIALILQANPRLTWRDVQHVVVNSSKGNWGSDGWMVNGAGLAHSYDFGFGLMDADAATRLAERWVNVPEEKQINSGRLQISSEAMSISPMNSGKYVWEYQPEGYDKRFNVESVELHLEASLKSRGELEIDLYSPSGMGSKLQERHLGDKEQDLSWTYTTVRHWNENPVGNWTLRVSNTSPRETAFVHAFYVTVYGHEKLTN